MRLENAIKETEREEREMMTEKVFGGSATRRPQRFWVVGGVTGWESEKKKQWVGLKASCDFCPPRKEQIIWGVMERHGGRGGNRGKKGVNQTTFRRKIWVRRGTTKFNQETDRK